MRSERQAAVDTGPLVALFDAADSCHQLARDFFADMAYDGWTTQAVITEVMFLLQFDLVAQLDFLRWLQKGALAILDINEDDFEQIILLMTKYHDVPMDYADATLVAVADRLEVRRIATFDSDFRIYRYRRRQPFETLLLDQI